MSIDPIAGLAADLRCDPLEAMVGGPRGATARRAHDVMVVCGFTGDESVLAGGQIDPLDDAELRQRIQRPEDRRPTQPQMTPPRGIEKVVGGEVALASGNEAGQRAPWRGQPVAAMLERTDDVAGIHHARSLQYTETQSQLDRIRLRVINGPREAVRPSTTSR